MGTDKSGICCTICGTIESRKKYNVAWDGMGWDGTAKYSTMQHSIYSIVWYDMVWYGMVSA